MAPFNSLSADQIGHDTILYNLLKMTAPCWSRCVYRYPPLANHTWTFWRNLEQNNNVRDTIPVEIPKNWKKNEHICNEIVLACPFCNSNESGNGIRKGNLEHLHLFCQSIHLKKARMECNQKIESALYAIYDFAAMREFNQTLSKTT
jgi:hypothetical protein